MPTATPTNYLGTAATWEKGRQLKQYGVNTYRYNNEGIRIQKTTSTEIHEYILDGTNIVKEKIKKKNGKRTKVYKIERISVNAEFKALGKKIEVRFEIAEFISDILFDVIFA